MTYWHHFHDLIAGSQPVAWMVLIASFALLAKCADIFVDSAVSLANRFRIPKLVIGIVLVSLATTAPELSVSLMSAIKGRPEMALGNAIGSVICDDGLALALCGIVATTAIPVIPHVLRTSGIFLVSIEVLAFAFVLHDNTLSRSEGVILVLVFVAYMAFLFHQHRKGKFGTEVGETTDNTNANPARILAMFVASLAGIILASDLVIASAETIASSFGIPESIIALTLVALGTSIPETATCIAAARKGEGALAVGNILGADIMNICWVAGASAIANDLTLGRKETLFMFPWMFAIVAAMLLLLRIRHNLTRKKGCILLALYIAYITSFFFVFPSG